MVFIKKKITERPPRIWKKVEILLSTIFIVQSQLDFYPNSQACFFFGERGKKERVIHLLHESSAAP